MGQRKARFFVCIGLAFALGWLSGSLPYARHAASGTGTIVYFSPEGGARNAILRQIHDAREEILIILYYFTDPGLADALAAANDRGVTVMVLLDKSQEKGRYSQARRLRDAGISVAFDARHRILHHKFMLVDGRILVTGSQNWTRSAETVNAENTLVITGDLALAHRFREEFHRLFGFTAQNPMQ